MKIASFVELHEPDRGALADLRLGMADEAGARQRHRRDLERYLGDPGMVPASVLGTGRLGAVAIAAPCAAESSALSVRVGRIVQLSVDDELAAGKRPRVLAELLAESRLAWREHFDLVTGVFDLDREGVLEGLQAHGARVFGAEATWALAPLEGPAHPVERFVREWTGPAGPVLACVDAAFAGSRGPFHADSRISREQADRVVRARVEKHLQAGGRMLVVQRGGRIAGFLAVETWPERERVAVLGIAGVAPDAGVPGVYPVLVRAAVSSSARAGVGWVLARAEADALAVQGVWRKVAGFRPRRIRQRVHWWLH